MRISARRACNFSSSILLCKWSLAFCRAAVVIRLASAVRSSIYRVAPARPMSLQPSRVAADFAFPLHLLSFFVG